MNCKPGDLAFLIRAPKEPCKSPSIVKVLHAAPLGDFKLPDGVTGSGEHLEHWVCESSSGDFIVLMEFSGETRKSKYASIPDEFLRPIRPDAEPESTTTSRELAEQ